MRSPPKRSGWTAGTLAAAATGGLFWLAGCHGGGTNPDGPTNDLSMTNSDMAMSPDMQAEPGAPTKSTASIPADRPLAAVFSPDGKTIYLTAHDANGVAQLYSVPVAGGALTKISVTQGAGSQVLIHPLGLAISADGHTLFIADSAGGTEDAGTVYVASTGGAVGATVTGIRAPGGVAVSADGASLFITATDPSNGKPGVFKAAAAGGAATVQVEGAPFVQPSGITVAADGNVYVVDATSLGARQGAVIKVAGTTATSISTQPLQVGYPAGISQAGIGSTSPLLLVTGTTGGLGTGVVYSVTAAGVATALTLGTTFFDPATIHRAATATAEVWVVVDAANAAQAGAAGTQSGSVYVLTP